MPTVELPDIEPDWIRVRSGAGAGAEGRIIGLAGLRRFALGVQLEVAVVVLDGETRAEVPLGDLERFA